MTETTGSEIDEFNDSIIESLFKTNDQQERFANLAKYRQKRIETELIPMIHALSAFINEKAHVAARLKKELAVMQKEIEKTHPHWRSTVSRPN